jgi:hypothetical protein
MSDAVPAVVAVPLTSMEREATVAGPVKEGSSSLIDADEERDDVSVTLRCTCTEVDRAEGR